MVNEEESKKSESDDELSDGEYEKALQKLNKIRAKNEAREEKGEDQKGQDQKVEEEEESSEDDIEIDDDDANSEAGDFRLFYSPLDSTNELFYVKTRLQGITISKINRIFTEKSSGI